MLELGLGFRGSRKAFFACVIPQPEDTRSESFKKMNLHETRSPDFFVCVLRGGSIFYGTFATFPGVDAEWSSSSGV